MKTTTTKTKKKAPKGINFALLEKFIEKAERFPRSIDMSNWGKPAATNDDHPCGTVACLAGHITLAANPRLYREWLKLDALIFTPGGLPDEKAERYDDIHPRNIAMSKLRITQEQASRLFHVDDWPEKFRVRYDNERYGFWDKDGVRVVPKNRPSIKAKILIARVRHFIKTEGRE